MQQQYRAFILCLLAVHTMFFSLYAADTSLHIIPRPVMLEARTGAFRLSGNMRIACSGTGSRDMALFFSDRIKKNTGCGLQPVQGQEAAVHFSINAVADTLLGNEGYRLDISPATIRLRANKPAGLFYGAQTLLQLANRQQGSGAAWAIPCASITDYPRFGWRGLMLDVSRHFFSVEEVKSVIDLMAMYKLNTFHWHLVDNEGWRIEIKKYPELTKIGGYRMQTVLDHNRDWPDSATYGGYYTQQQIKEVVQYATQRHISIVPEIEMPAHSLAALRALPQLKCPLVKDSKSPGAYNIIYCPTDSAFSFLEDVLSEVIPLFPGKYIHIGGDEANKIPWIESAFCQELIRKLGLKDEHELQSYFIRRMEKFINAKGKNIIGWDEILEGGLAPNAAVMSWRGEKGGIAAAQQRHNVVMTPGPNGLYFDHYQSGSPMEPNAHVPSYGGFAPLSKTYSYDPVPASLDPQQQSYIMGVQANLWTEHIGTMARVQYMIIPRIFALAEIAWTPVARKNYSEFASTRVPAHLARFDAMGYNYRVPTALPETDTLLTGGRFTFRLAAPVAGSHIYYTLNGRAPGDYDWLYKEPLTIIVPPGEKRELRTLVITPAGRRSIATKTIMYNCSDCPH